MRGWGADDDFQLQIQATVEERVESARLALQGKGSVTCEDCGSRIPKARRLAAPNATRCIDCQDNLEWNEGW